MPKPGPRTTYKYTDKFKATAEKKFRLPESDFTNSRTRFPNVV